MAIAWRTTAHSKRNINTPIRNTMKNEKSTYLKAVVTHGARCTCDKLSEKSAKLFQNVWPYGRTIAAVVYSLFV